ncbi:MAG TPA: hypothetical protein VG389_26630, partial [Myxococcota bacterium]|nr:hypothetical protein [Myxococcota bacterium]
GRLLAVARTAASSPEMDVDVFDLASGTGRTLGRFSTVESLEWLRDGLVVQHTVDTAEGVADEAGELHTVAELTYVPLAGASRLLWSGERLDGPIAAASRGGRVTFFAGGKVLSADALRPGSVPLVHGSYLGEVRNVEVSPFGGRAAFVTWDGVYVVEGDGAPREIDALGGVHTIWFSDDGAALAYASPARAVFVTRDTVAYLDATALDLRALRFRRDAPGLLVSFQHELVAWDPTTGTKKVLATVKAPEDLEGADVYTGGKLLWRSKLEASKGTLLD